MKIWLKLDFVFLNNEQYKMEKIDYVLKVFDSDS